jgi:hypothetical protein
MHQPVGLLGWTLLGEAEDWLAVVRFGGIKNFEPNPGSDRRHFVSAVSQLRSAPR